ncbi:ribonuclease E/G [Thalassobaculum salexigens]|uniref:ribonuclease E/G n=1 Tax=Thalassobaculum salexigens TaxID=455360 RepID=UPI00040BBF1B|nr:ribonuclease E/G [Thalassobaculum salexigens]
MSPAGRAILHATPGVTRVLFLQGGEIVEIWVEGDDAPSLIGGVALVTARTAGGASVADLPTGSGYLRDGRANDGEKLIVQVTGDGSGGKRAVLRRRVELAGDGVVLTPFQPELGIAATVTGKARRAAIRTAVAPALPDGIGAMVRSAGADRHLEDLAAEAARLAGLWQVITDKATLETPPCWLLPPPDLADRAAAHLPGAEIVVDRDGAAFRAAGGEEALDRALARSVAVADGIALVVEEAETATLIDVNLARSPRGEALVRANVQAAVGAAAVARLRGLRGTLLIDPPRMRGRADRARVAAALAEATASDPAPWQILGWTPGGMLECLRESPRRPLSEDMLSPLGERRRSARARAWTALARLAREVGGIARPRLSVPEDVAGWLEGPGAFIVAAERRRLGALTVAADPTLGPEDSRIDGNG